MIAEAYDVPPGQLVFPSSLSREAPAGCVGDGYEILASAGPPPRTEDQIPVDDAIAIG